MAPKGTTLPSKAQPGGRAFVINGPTYSDGDVSQMCTRDNATLTHPNSDAYQAYLQKIATKWIDEEAGGAEAGRCIFDHFCYAASSICTSFYMTPVTFTFGISLSPH